MSGDRQRKKGSYTNLCCSARKPRWKMHYSYNPSRTTKTSRVKPFGVNFVPPCFFFLCYAISLLQCSCCRLREYRAYISGPHSSPPLAPVLPLLIYECTASIFRVMRFSSRFKNVRFTIEEGASLVFEKSVRFGPNDQVCAPLLQIGAAVMQVHLVHPRQIV